MRIYDIIAEKMHGGELSKEEINFFVEHFASGDIPDYQASALLMAICLKGMTDEETFFLTVAMLKSGKTIDLSSIPGKKVDKHSTGGVGDKTTLVLGPMLAACGGKFAKMSGRGLGHTGGTIDKLESIPGFKTDLTVEQFIDQVKRIGIAIMSQTDDIVPADKKMYALRDATATVDSIPLIASSIMSKKMADGSDIQLLDVKYGNGAFMKDLDSARKLANLMVTLGHKAGLNTSAEITDMSQPLGYEIGNALEVKEAIKTLKNQGPADLTEICLHSGTYLLMQAGLALNKDTARKKLEKCLADGSALDAFKRMVEAQGGDVSFIDSPDKFPNALYSYDVKALTDGFIQSIDAYDLGLSAMELGAGRAKEGDVIDHAAGITLAKKRGDLVKRGDVLCTLHSERPIVEKVGTHILRDFIIGPIEPGAVPLIEEDII